VKYHYGRHVLESRGTDSSSSHSRGRVPSTLGLSIRFSAFFHDVAAFDKMKASCFAGYRVLHALYSFAAVCFPLRGILVCNKVQTYMTEGVVSNS
jgi:hypothetical protein